MSESLDGIEWVPPPGVLRPAAAVVLVRGTTQATREVFWVRRGERLAFSGGFHAFPGGKVDRGDADVAIAGVSSEDASHRAAALRELFEETGVLLTLGDQPMAPARVAELRAELLAGGSFADLLRRERIQLDGAGLISAGRWVTPTFSPVRFDARFYLAQMPVGAEASVIRGELEAGGWVRPADALAQWESGTALLHPPTHHALATLAGLAPEAAIAQLRRVPFADPNGVAERIEFQRGILMFPMLTPTLPPAQHTHCYILGTGELLVVDPGAPSETEQDRLGRLLAELASEGRRVSAIALTHYHRDHVGAAAAMARLLGVPVWAHAETAARVPGAVGRLRDGDVLELKGPMAMRWQVVHTPGHADGHVCFMDLNTHAIIAGDMVAGGSTVVIDPPEGDMGLYLSSLRRLLELNPRALYPAHGMPMPDGPTLLRHYLEHRESRMDAIEEAVAGGHGVVREIVEKVYADTPPWLWPAADRSALASLLELERRGRVRASAEGGWLAGMDPGLEPEPDLEPEPEQSVEPGSTG